MGFLTRARACGVSPLLAVIAACGGVDNRTQDTTPPTLSLPGDQTVYATSAAGARVEYLASATDDFAVGTIPIACTPAVGQFPIGTTTVTCSATDASRNTSTGRFNVTVTDTDVTKPVLTLPKDVVVSTNNPAGTFVTWATAPSKDDRDGDIPTRCQPGPGTFPVGASTVTCSATDAGGNVATGTFVVTVSFSTDTILQIDAGGAHVCAVLSDHTARCWGGATFGRLGDGLPDLNATETAERDALTPSLVVTDLVTPSAPPNALTGIESISAGEQHTCALMQDHTVQCWGLRNFGALGHPYSGPHAAELFAQPVLNADGSPLTHVTAIAVGTEHTCALISGGTVRCWGRNRYGTLGNGQSSFDVVNPLFSISPLAVLDQATGSELAGVAAISAGTEHTCARMNDGTARCWGRGLQGRLGNGDVGNRIVEYPEPVLVDATTPLTGILSIEAGATNTCALLQDHTVRCWGLGAASTPNGFADHTSVVLRSDGVTPLADVASIAAGGERMCARLDDSELRCWGRAALGDGTSNDSAFAVPVTAPPDAVALSVGRSVTCVLADTGGAARCWGSNERGQLGTGTYSPSLVPVNVTGIP